MENLTTICRGHLIHTTARCYKCRNDSYNKRCPNYKPFYIVMFEVVADSQEKNRTSKSEPRVSMSSSPDIPIVGEASLDNESSRFDERGMYK